jgi:hypothetical protein
LKAEWVELRGAWRRRSALLRRQYRADEDQGSGEERVRTAHRGISECKRYMVDE